MLAVATEGCSGNTILQAFLFFFDILQQPKKQLHWSIFHQALWAEHLLWPLCNFSSVGYSFLREVLSFCWSCSVPGSFLLRGNTSSSLLHSRAQQKPSLELSTSGTVAPLMWAIKSWRLPNTHNTELCLFSAARHFRMSLCHHFPNSYKYFFFSYVENGKPPRDHRDERGQRSLQRSVGTSTCAHSLHVGFAL